MNKELKKIINDEYYNLKKNFNSNNKNKIKSNSKDIEDYYHDSLLKVLEHAELTDFKFINKEKTINYIKKTMFIKSKHLRILKHNKKEQVEEAEKSELIDMINRNYSNEQIQKSIFAKLFQ